MPTENKTTEKVNAETPSDFQLIMKIFLNPFNPTRDFPVPRKRNNEIESTCETFEVIQSELELINDSRDKCDQYRTKFE